jgi:hypothetical protein
VGRVHREDLVDQSGTYPFAFYPTPIFAVVSQAFQVDHG